MKNLDIYNNRFMILENINIKIYIKFILLLVLFIILSILLITREYPNIYKVEGFASNDKIVVPILKKDLEKLKGEVLKIDNKTYKYSVFSYDYIDNYSNELLVTLLVDMDFKKNKVVSILIEDGKTTLYKSFIKKIWKGF